MCVLSFIHLMLIYETCWCYLASDMSSFVNLYLNLITYRFNLRWQQLWLVHTSYLFKNILPVFFFYFFSLYLCCYLVCLIILIATLVYNVPIGFIVLWITIICWFVGFFILFYGEKPTGVFFGGLNMFFCCFFFFTWIVNYIKLVRWSI